MVLLYFKYIMRNIIVVVLYASHSLLDFSFAATGFAKTQEMFFIMLIEYMKIFPWEI